MLHVIGESEEVAGTVDSNEPNFLEAHNVALLGTHVCNGTATAVVVLTGARTVMGRINKLTNSAVEQRTNLQKEISRFVFIIIGLTASLVVIMLITWLAWLRKDHYTFLPTVGILTNLMSLIVAFIPEGMPIAVALTLSLVARRMRDAKVLPKSLSTVETLGFVNVICSDKTGTLTENKMSVVSFGFVDQAHTRADGVPHETASFGELRKGMVLCNDAFFDPSTEDLPLEEKTVQGNATDGALLRFASSLPSGTDAVNGSYARVFDVPFNSKNKFALTYIERKDGEKGRGHIIVKGAPDILMARCVSYISAVDDGHVRPFDAEAKRALVSTQEAWSRRGERVILLAQREYQPVHASGTIDFEQELAEEATRELAVIGLVGILDPPRGDIPHTVTEVRRCGARFFMVTGDFSLTACAIAQQIGILSRSTDPDRIPEFEAKGRFAELEPIRHDRLASITGGLLVEGKEIPDVTEEQWDVICKYEEIVFARTTPEQKLKIVTELRNRGCVVAVTGDGVNDAPALKAANGSSMIFLLI
jgi:sodium/potassium-transporting ATPase subunit alpha